MVKCRPWRAPTAGIVSWGLWGPADVPTVAGESVGRSPTRAGRWKVGSERDSVQRTKLSRLTDCRSLGVHPLQG